MIASMPLDGEYGSWSGPLPPSSEWRIHLDIFKARPDAGALIHTHSLFATTLSMLRKPIPAAHYMIAAFGGPTIRCTDYAPFGTQDLSDLAVAGLEERTGVLLGSHGMVVMGATLDEAMWRAVELETLAKMYYPRLQHRHAGHPRRRRNRPRRREVQNLWLQAAGGAEGDEAGEEAPHQLKEQDPCGLAVNPLICAGRLALVRCAPIVSELLRCRDMTRCATPRLVR